MRRRPRGLTVHDAFRWHMPGDPPFIPGAPPEEQPCWDWSGSRTHEGYGQIVYNAAPAVLAHRASYELFVGPIGGGLSVLHSCDRPGCVQPLHLRPGTPRENMADAMARGQWAIGCNRANKLDSCDVRFIRESSLAQHRLARMFGVSQQTISAIRLNRTWRHVV